VFVRVYDLRVGLSLCVCGAMTSASARIHAPVFFCWLVRVVANSKEDGMVRQLRGVDVHDDASSAAIIRHVKRDDE
jgi:hypothetical protein